MRIRHKYKCGVRSGGASTGSWLFFSKNKQTQAGEGSAVGQVSAPDGPWLIQWQVLRENILASTVEPSHNKSASTQKL